MTRKPILLIAVCAAGLVGVLLGRGLAVPNGATANVLTYAGTLTGVDSGTQQFTFKFNKMGSSCNSIVASGVIDPNGGFSVPIDVSGCGSGFFDGSDVTVDVGVAGVSLTGQPLTPVPYAKYADRSASAVQADSAPFGGLSGKYVISGPNGRSYSVGGTQFCMQTAATPGAISAAADAGTFSGYLAAKQLCEQKCGSTSAHMCTPEEMVRSTAIGAAPATATLWIAAGTLAQDPTSGITIGDCGGWKSADGTKYSGTVWTGDHAESRVCSAGEAIACCD